MKVYARKGISAILFAVTNAALFGAPHSANATTATISTSTDTLVELPFNGNTTFSGATRLTAEGSTSGAAMGFWDYGVIDFNTVGLVPQLTQATAINSLTLNLVDKAEGFGVAGVVDLYATDYTGSLTSLSYQTDAGSQPSGIGTGLDNRYLVGQITYTKTFGQVYSTALDLSNATLKNFIVNQLNTGGNIRFAVAVHTSGTAADFEGSAGTASLAAPSLNLDFTTSSTSATNTLFSISPGANSTAVTPANGTVGKALSITLPRVVNTANVFQNITVTNTGTQAGNYTLIGSTGNLTVANGLATSGTLPVPENSGVSNITVGFNGSTIKPGSTRDVSDHGIGPVSATVLIRNQSNSGDPDALVTITAQQVVATRLIDNDGANGTPVQFGKVLAGVTSPAQSVLLDTQNTGAFDSSNQSLTKVQILGSTALSNSPLSGVVLGTNDKISVAAGTDQTFDSGTDTTSRPVSFTGGTVGGLYQTNSFYDGYGSLPVANLDTAIGAADTTARIYVEADVYQPASVTSASSGTVVTLTNAPHTVNVASSALGDIGARSAAFVTSVALSNAQTGWTVDPALIPSASIGDGLTVNAASFDATGKLNGTYTGKLAVGLQNDQSITGAAPNDLGTQNFTLSAVVSANSGNGTANILPGGSLAGYSIHRGSAKDSTIKFLAGTSTSGGNISVAWADGVNTTLSDKATVANSASGLYVLQMSYDSTALTNGTTSPTLASKLSNKFVGATFGDGSVTPVELNSAYDGNPVLGHFGIDTTNHVVWAVVNYAGDFEVTQRLLGDANGDGAVDLSDLSTVLNNFGSTTALWSTGNFDGAPTIDLTDLSDVLNSFGSSVPTVSVATGGTIGEVPEPASLGLLSIGLLPLLKRRRH